jgi:3-deoxy-D-manno-octulosonic-acid transferase
LNAKKFISLVQPKLAVFIKYEFWYFHLNELKNRDIPVILISGIFRNDQLFFRWYGRPLRSVLNCFGRFFLQDDASLHLLQSIGITNAEISGDTRFDRVWQISQQPLKLPIIESFNNQKKIFVAGSTWPEDEKIIGELINSNTNGWKWIIVPHEINSAHLSQLKNKWPAELIFYSQTNEVNLQEKKILMIDQVGLLSSVYSYADMAYIGGGFGKGIHNILEAAVFGIPVIFGPNYQKFNEANELLELGGAKSVSNGSDLKNAFQNFTEEEIEIGEVNRNYVIRKKGATERIMNYLIKEGAEKQS